MFEKLQDYLRSLNPKKSEHKILIYGSQYKLWREGKFIGIAIWCEDSNVGDSFQKQSINESGELINNVYIADKWELFLESK